MEIDLSKFKWTREPESCVIQDHGPVAEDLLSLPQ